MNDTEITEILKISSSANKGGDFGLGEDNVSYEKYFSEKSYLKKRLTTEMVDIANVTFNRVAKIIGIFIIKADRF